MATTECFVCKKTYHDSFISDKEYIGANHVSMKPVCHKCLGATSPPKDKEKTK